MDQVYPYLEVIGRSILVYGAVIIAFRLAGKKHVSELSFVDFILILLVSDAVQNSMVGENHSVEGGIIAAATLIAMNVLLTKIINKNPRIAKIVEGEPVLLVHNGHLLKKRLAEQSLRIEEIHEAMHENGIAKLSDVLMAILETDGTIPYYSKGKEMTRRESAATKKERFQTVYTILDNLYPDTETALEHSDEFELLTAVILSAQCTDARVNIVMRDFRPRFPTPQSLADASLEAIQEIIRPTGFFHQKAKSLKSMATDVVTKFGGKVPQTMEELITLRGVGRKTANVVLGNAFDIIEGIAVDTHVTRLSNRLNFTKHEDPKQIEKDLMLLAPKEYWTNLTHLLISHGRGICKARKPQCPDCAIADYCPSRDLFYK